MEFSWTRRTPARRKVSGRFETFSSMQAKIVVIRYIHYTNLMPLQRDAWDEEPARQVAAGGASKLACSRHWRGTGRIYMFYSNVDECKGVDNSFKRL